MTDSVFGFTKLTAVLFFRFCWHRYHLSFMHVRDDARNDIVLCWIGPTNCQPKWLLTRSAVIWHEEKYFDCWFYHAARWTVNKTTWKTVPKPPNSAFENRTAETEFLVFESWGRFGLVSRKPISDIFIRFCTPLPEISLVCHHYLHILLQRYNNMHCDAHILFTYSVQVKGM